MVDFEKWSYHKFSFDSYAYNNMKSEVFKNK